jgi:hypothetical protein
MSLSPKRPVHTSLHRTSAKVPETSNSTFSGISLATVIISGFALTGAIFLWMLRNAGYAYRIEYLLTFGFQPDTLPWTADDLVYLGYNVQEAFALFMSLVLYGGNWMDRYLEERRIRKGIGVVRKKKENFVTKDVIFLWGAALALMVLLYCSVIPQSLLGPVRKRGERDALAEIKVIRDWNVVELQKRKLNFVEITHDKTGPVSGVVISCTDKFCALYSPVGPAHTHTVPLPSNRHAPYDSLSSSLQRPAG